MRPKPPRKHRSDLCFIALRVSSVKYRPLVQESDCSLRSSAYKLGRGRGADIIDSTVLDKELDVWQADGCAVRIAYSRAVMEELRLAAVDGFHRLAHGGVEIGGVLFGVRDPDGVKILAHRELACEYVFGPSFTLSENDRRALEELLVSPSSDSQLSGMQPVGWYQSHTRSEILLSEDELQFYQRYFPEIWQIALVLRPHRFDPVRAGFFHREPDGSVQAAASRHEFYIEPAAVKPVPRLPEDRAPVERQPQPLAVPLSRIKNSEPPPSPAPPAVSETLDGAGRGALQSSRWHWRRSCSGTSDRAPRQTCPCACSMWAANCGSTGTTAPVSSSRARAARSRSWTDR